MIRRLLELAQDYPEAGAAALYHEGMGVDEEMVSRIPVDTGRLRSTHYTAPPVEDRGGFVVEVGVATDYAAAVHERTEVRHPVGEAKFLENALHARAAGMGQRMANKIETYAANGVGVRALSAKDARANTPRIHEGKVRKLRRTGRGRKGDR